ncbi:MAG: hypothetical protein Q4A11_02020 [Brachymonas sp.]|nr:hypothetical protein [Brachymonas sp.]
MLFLFLFYRKLIAFEQPAQRLQDSRFIAEKTLNKAFAKAGALSVTHLQSPGSKK